MARNVNDDPLAARRQADNGSDLYTMNEIDYDLMTTARQDFGDYNPATDVVTVNNGTGGGTNGGGSGSGSGSTGGGSGSGSGVSGGSAQSIYENYLQQILSDQQAAAQARQQALQENYNRALATLQQNHNQQVNNLQTNADDSLRQAYISYMLGQKGINQQLANSGINGGATESILANLYNNYGSNRNSIKNQLQQSLSELGTNYNSNVADLANNYGNNLADVLADYYNNASSTKENYANKIATLLASNSGRSGSGSSSGSSTNGLYLPGNLTDGQRSGIESAIARYNNGNSDASSLSSFLLGLMTPAEAYNVLYDRGINPADIGISLGSGNSGSGGNGSGSGNGNGGTLQTETHFQNQTWDNTARVDAINNIKRMLAQIPDEASRASVIDGYTNNLMRMYGLSQADVDSLVVSALR